MPRELRTPLLLGILVTVALLNTASTRGDALADGAGDLSPIKTEEWSYDLAAHLLERAGFGGTPEEIERLAAMAPRDAVRSLVHYQDQTDVDLPPFDESGIFPAPDWSPARTSQAFRHILFGEIAPFLERLFLSRDFYSAASYATQIKSPVQLVVSTWRKLGLEEAPTWPSFAQVTGGLGQRVFQPPNVKGWDGGRTWINPSTLLQRQNAMRYLLFPEEAPVVVDAHLQGSRRLSGDFIHEQFLAGAADGDFKTFPRGGERSMAGATSPSAATSGAATSGVATNMPSAAEETAKLSGEDFNLFRGVFNGAWRSWQRVGPAPRQVARFRVSDWLAAARVTDAEGAVDYLLRRFVRVPLDPERERTLAGFLESQLGGEPLSLQDGRHETALRELLHLVLSTPEYQLV